MNRLAAFTLVVITTGFPALAFAQDHQHVDGMSHASARTATITTPQEGGQAAFAAIGEVVTLLLADPKTDWSKVSIDRLRDHLVDMDNVTLRARVTTRPVPGGAQFQVSGATEPVRQAIQRMVASHSATPDSENGWHLTSTKTEDGAVMTVTSADKATQAKIAALGFFGLLAAGAHHQTHHLMMTKGEMSHGPPR